jgi:hypothetical protein
MEGRQVMKHEMPFMQRERSSNSTGSYGIRDEVNKELSGSEYKERRSVKPYYVVKSKARDDHPPTDARSDCPVRDITVLVPVSLSLTRLRFGRGESG